MNKENILNKDIIKVLDILERRFDIGTNPQTLVFSDGTETPHIFADDYVDEKLRVGIRMSDIEDMGLSVGGCWDTLSLLNTKIPGFKIVGKFKTGYNNTKYKEFASKLDEPPAVFEVLLPKDFIEISKKIKDRFSDDKDLNKNNDDKDTNSFVKEVVVGPLIYTTKGDIYFKKKLLKLRSQLKTLCILFMENHEELVDYSTIRDELTSAKKRPNANPKNINKYVSELHKLLRGHFKKNVIFTHEKEGYIFDINRSS